MARLLAIAERAGNDVSFSQGDAQIVAARRWRYACGERGLTGAAGHDRAVDSVQFPCARSGLIKRISLEVGYARHSIPEGLTVACIGPIINERETAKVRTGKRE